MSYLKKRSSAFHFALQGLTSAIKREPHIKIHLGATLFVVCFGAYVKVTAYDWCILVFAIGLVIISELFNTAIEKLCDLVMPQAHPAVKYIKDVSAAAVLCACIVSIIMGYLVLWPYIATLAFQ